MAANPIGRDTPAVTLPGIILPMPAVARILARHDRQRLASFIAVAIDLCDAMDGDPEAEAATWPEAIEAREHDECLPDDSESGGDDRDSAWIEWHTMRCAQKRGPAISPGPEDDETIGAEDDYHPEGGSRSFDLGRSWPAGPGCPISDPDAAVDDRGCDEQFQDMEPEEEGEREQMANDVPMLPVVTYEFNIFTDKRDFLGLGNLVSSFRSGREIRSADSGAQFILQANGRDLELGSPV